jgi:hypothetical protein
LRPEAFLQDLLDLLPSAETIVVDNLAFCPGVDKVIQAHQAKQIKVEGGGGGGSPSFRLVVRGNANAVEKLNASYEGIQFSLFSNIDSDSYLSSLIASSRHTLRRLSIPLAASTDLSSFPHLEHLSLRLSVHQPSHVMNDLIRVLPPLTSLRQLVLGGSVYENDLTELVADEKLIKSLPPSLTHLSIEHETSLTYVLHFVAALVRATRCQRLNMKGLSQAVEGEAGLARKCEEERLSVRTVHRSLARGGMELSFGEEWKIW